jgi:putative ABC transport system permease protein
MRLNLFHIVKRSLIFNKSALLYQGIIIALLSGIITGSLLVGKSVRNSLKTDSIRRLGNTGILVSSGIRYFDQGLPRRVAEKINAKCAGFIELRGHCQNFETGKSAGDVKIIGVTPGFIRLQGNDSLMTGENKIAVNTQLAQHLGIKAGDDIIIKFSRISDFPSNAPFSPGREDDRSVVLTVGKIITADEGGNFSLGISQIVPFNLFINITDLEKAAEVKIKINRLIIERGKDIDQSIVYDNLREILTPEDIGLNCRPVNHNSKYELTSGRIFIDREITDDIISKIPEAMPIITYLANSIEKGKKSTPYSFVAALPPGIGTDVPSGNEIFLNRWVADDIGAAPGDSVKMSWYTNQNDRLEERDRYFRVSGVVGMDGIWADSLLMPEFPGIAGRESCTSWDAGSAISLDRIRKKDEEYWNRYKGTPKAFISYADGKDMWENNFGPATAIRFPAGWSEQEIRSKLRGSLKPDRSGFIIRNLYNDSIKAAESGVDFSTLFISLGFFIVISSILLLSLVVSLYFDSRKSYIYTLRALGFTSRKINLLLFLESVVISVAGIITGIIAGGFFNYEIIRALNSVWSGAVQMNTLNTSFDLPAMLSGSAISLFLILVFLKLKISAYIKKLNRTETGSFTGHSQKSNAIALAFSCSVFLILTVLSLIHPGRSIPLAFSGGTMLLVSVILIIRQLILKRRSGQVSMGIRTLSARYYAFFPSHVTTPVLFIAAGIFILIVTSSNRKSFSLREDDPSGGTGGYLFWCETTLPVIASLNSDDGLKKVNIEKDELKGMSIVQVRKAAGDDASCLNLNHITTPAILGLDPSSFISGGSFSFASVMKEFRNRSPWEILNLDPSGNTVYGIADQTVLEWGLKIGVGDTLTIRAENGQPLNIIVAAGLKSSIFQGNIITGLNSFNKFFPSVGGNNIFLIGGKPRLSEEYKNLLTDRLLPYGIDIYPANERLAGFYQVTNTYLAVFSLLGTMGMILGVFGLGFVLLRNYNSRKKEFALMLASGFSLSSIKKFIFSEQVFILVAGIISGILPALIATLPTMGSLSDFPWEYLILMISMIFISGMIALLASVSNIRQSNLASSLRKE